MKIFGFLKRLSNKKEIENIRLEEIDSWVNSQSMKLFEGINSELKGIKEKISKEKEKVERNIQKLEEGKIKNKNIPYRAKYMMEDNRKIYIQKVINLLEKFELPEKFDEIPKFYNSINIELDSFGKGTFRNHVILQEFFVNEIENISGSIKALSELVKKAKKTAEDPEVVKVNELKNKINEVQQKIKLKETLESGINITKEDLEKEKKKVKVKVKEINDIEKGIRYKRFIELANKKEELEKEIKNLEQEPLHSFSVINAALKKYERMTLDEKLVREYLEDYLRALLKDREFMILDVFEKMKKSIIEGKIELKDKKKDKILLELDKLGKDYLKEFVEKHNKLGKKISELKSEMDKEKVIDEVEKLREELNRKIANMKKSEEKKNSIQRRIDAIDIGLLKKDLGEKIKENSGKIVKVL
jgi:hypothetical protein